MWALPDTEISRRIDFKVDNEFVVPNSASVSLFDPSGNLLDVQSLETEGTQGVVTFEEHLNSLPVGEKMTERYLVISFLYEGMTYTSMDSYVVALFYPLRVTPADVRSELGLDVSELHDDEVDLLRALLSFDDEVIAALSTPGVKSNAANEAVKCQAALAIVGSLQFRVGIQLKSEENTFARAREFSVEEVEMRLARKVDHALRIISNDPTPSANLFSLSTPTDAITGV